MKIRHNVKSTAKDVPHVEVNNVNDTVYVRYDITWLEEIDFSGWNIGTEIQYKFQDFIKSLPAIDDVESISLVLATLMSETDYLRDRVDKLEGRGS